ncbi:MAG: hypothetical protein AABX17_02510 [Nanoarchaeota archaeon]
MKKGRGFGVVSHKAQVTVFVIIAIILVVGLAGFFIAKNFIPATIPTNIQPVYTYYTSCLENIIQDGASILASQGGYIETPEFEAGTEYAPFSSQLAFMGLGIPYWYYISGNGVKKEQIPTKANMESALGKYVKEKSGNCDFSDFEAKGYILRVEDATSGKATINADNIAVSINQRIVVDYGDTHFVLGSHSVKANSELGTLYDTAKNIYNYEKNQMFLENYSLDVLYTYAPVDGVIFECAPAVWNPYDVAAKLKNALATNIGMIKLNGEYYTSKGEYTDYFIAGKNSNIDLKNEQVAFQYSPSWPSRIEIWPTKNNVMIAEPVGTQPGLNVMGFCYTPYKFVYDVYFPVLIQVFNKNNAQEIFQFPVSIVISKNTAREAGIAEYIEQTETICDSSNADVSVNTYNVNLLPVEASLEFKCFNDVCDLGKTKINNATGISSASVKVPQCVNGILTASADGYKDKKYIISTNEESSADIVLDKEYKVPLEVYVDGSLTNELSVLTISEKKNNAYQIIDSVSYPYSKQLSIAEGDYNFDLKIYKKSAIVVPATTTKQCVNMPKDGLLGFFGATQEKCTDLTIPAQTLSNYVYAGGKQNYYVTPSELEKAKSFKIFARSVATPNNIQQAQDNYEMVSAKVLDIQII